MRKRQTRTWLGAGAALAMLLGAGGALAQPTQAQLDRFAATLKVGYTVLDNRPAATACAPAPSCMLAELTLSAPEAPAAGWSLYFSSVDKIQNAGGDLFALTHINGDLYRLTPTAAFAGFAPGQPIRIALRLDGHQLSELYPMPNHYVAADGLAARTIASTRPVIDPETGLESLAFVAAFTDEARLAGGSAADATVWATAPRLYQVNAATGASVQPIPRGAILPTPLDARLDPNGASLDLSRGVAVSLAGAKRAELAAALSRLAKVGVGQAKGGAPLKITVAAAEALSPGAYRLTTTVQAIQVTASDAEGAANGLASLTALVDARRSVPVLTIDDAPRFAFRGLHIDVARNFHSKAEVLAILDQMAAYKLNRLHLHLADDEGWRVEIMGLPELTQVGSRRCHDLAERTCLIPQLGSGPDPSTPVNGFYSRADYIEIVRAAQARHIQVIPSFDMPGHSRAAIKAMEARAARLRAAGRPEAEAGRYLLSEAANKSVYSSIQHYSDNTINVCLDSSYAFLGKVVDEMARLHAAAGQPLTRYHIGADETPGAWTDSPACAAYEKKAGVAPADLGGHFIERVSAMLAAKGVVPAGWSDGMSHAKAERMPGQVHSNNWGALGGEGPASAHLQANQGWEVVISTPEVLYFDSPYAADPKERGYDWPSRATGTRKVFDFMPENLPAHAELWTDLHGKDQASKDEHPLKPGVRFAGLQGQLWSETIRSDAQVDYMLYPRMLALAERAWHVADWEEPYAPGAGYSRATGAFDAAQRARRDADWNAFANLLGGRELARLDAAGVAYRVPSVGAVVEGGKLRANVEFPGLPIEYRVEGGAWRLYVPDAPVSGRVEVRARTADGKRAGRSLVVQ
ncbi:N-acetyl-beta-hexosaminidase [Caulobacter sp. AP07]|uniref:family 20 glycosylhydrolase n=1 Tax=Caulobacter sp. AP07 TaxID=1144304 RepID=UPI0002722552|nr:family 20 glycosylhydrolase [Caulobacter sp. AP07]EJL31200.1 N-acetyl-beta-hexosaminidase [Caulobacter sp. AP07]